MSDVSVFCSAMLWRKSAQHVARCSGNTDGMLPMGRYAVQPDDTQLYAVPRITDSNHTAQEYTAQLLRY